MKITTDWHIHTRNSCDSASLTVDKLMHESAAAGIEHYGITDHVHTAHNLPDLTASWQEFTAAEPPPNFHFGVEVSCVSEWELDVVRKGQRSNPVYGVRTGGTADCPLAVGLRSEDIERYQIEYVIGGTHWPLYVPMEREAVIRDYHRQNMFLAKHPLVNIVAHPWWWMGHWADEAGNFKAEPWFDNFQCIPQSMHDEFAAAVREHDSIVEINISAILMNPRYPARFVTQYLAYLADLKTKGVRFAIGSDCHTAAYAPDFAQVGEMLDSVGIDDSDLWTLPPRAE